MSKLFFFPCIFCLVRFPSTCGHPGRTAPRTVGLADLLFQKLRIIIHVQHTHVLSHLGEQHWVLADPMRLGYQGKDPEKTNMFFFACFKWFSHVFLEV